MSQYQKHHRNATFGWVNLIALSLLLSSWGWQPVQAKQPFALSSHLARQQQPAQPGANDLTLLRQLLLLPADATIATLQTHTADFHINEDSNNLAFTLDALYRLKNPGHSPLIVAVKLVPDQPATPVRLPENIQLLAGEQSLPLAPLETGYSTQVQLGADSTVDLHLSYTMNLGNTPLPNLSYALSALKEWPVDPQNSASLRITLFPASSISPDSWLPPTPADWRYTQPADGDQPGIKWLYDAEVPDQPIDFRFIHPARWQALQAAQKAATPEAAPAIFSQLGDSLRQLYADIPLTDNNSTIRERFYAQALAAYSAGVERAENTNAIQDLATLHTGLATLYRDHTLDTNGKINVDYAALMAKEAALALKNLADEGDQRRGELLQWQMEGLNAQLEAARRQRAWGEALRIVDEMAQLPPAVNSTTTLSETRHAILVQQALQFLAQDNHAAAAALAGNEIGDPALLPPTENRALFTSWQVTTTITPDEIQLQVTAIPLPDRQAQAQKALQTLSNLWQLRETSRQGFSFALATDATAANNGEPLRLAITLAMDTLPTPSVQAMPPDANWALLRTLLLQIAPQIERQSQFLRQRIALRQPLDLRAAGDQWDAMAANLERQAADFEAQSAALNATDTANAENALRLRVQSANYRNAAQEWRALARNSWAITTLAAPAGLQTVSRSWLTTVTTPAQALTLQSEALNPGRLTLAFVSALLGLFLLAGVLWWLL